MGGVGAEAAGWTVAELLARRPQAAWVFFRHRMACVGCVLARFETVAEAVAAYGLDLQAFLREIGDADEGGDENGNGNGKKIPEREGRD